MGLGEYQNCRYIYCKQMWFFTYQLHIGFANILEKIECKWKEVKNTGKMTQQKKQKIQQIQQNKNHSNS